MSTTAGAARGREVKALDARPRSGRLPRVTKMSEGLTSIYRNVLKRNPGEVEFHQAVREVLETLGPALTKYPELREGKIIAELVPTRQELA
jgi:hypothetical protein